MHRVTKNNQDYLFRIAEFLQGYGIREPSEIKISAIPSEVKVFVAKLVDDMVITQDFEVKLVESLINTLMIMVDNPNHEKFD